MSDYIKQNMMNLLLNFYIGVSDCNAPFDMFDCVKKTVYIVKTEFSTSSLGCKKHQYARHHNSKYFYFFSIILLFSLIIIQNIF